LQPELQSILRFRASVSRSGTRHRRRFRRRMPAERSAPPGCEAELQPTRYRAVADPGIAFGTPPIPSPRKREGPTASSNRPGIAYSELHSDRSTNEKRVSEIGQTPPCAEKAAV